MTKLPKEVVKIFKKKLDTKAVLDYYENLVEDWHDGKGEAETLQEHLNLDDKLFALYFDGETKFVEELYSIYKNTLEA